MDNIREYINNLNEEQIKPVLDTEGAVLVIAGAGSGKTRVLTGRIAHLIADKGVQPGNILAITFTNKAADEMKVRLQNLVGYIEDMWVSTIHSMCVRILRRDIEKLGFHKSFSIYDETDKEKVLKRVIESLNYGTEKYLKMAKDIISSAKNDGLSPEEYRDNNSNFYCANEMYNIYKKYQEECFKSNALDFDDLLVITYKLLTERKDVLEYYSNKFRYIHIDEFQDTNSVQFEIAKLLSSKHNNIFVVGDDDQSIYGWRGAKIENILEFDKIFSNAKVYKLERNYRSTKKILALANEIIKNNTGRREKELWTENQDGVKIETFVGTNETYEAGYILNQISALVSRGVYKYKDIAVFMRVNALSRNLELECRKYGVPYKILGGFKFFERKEIKDLLSYLKLITNTYDDEAFLRAISTPKRGIGDKTLRELKEFSSANYISLYEGLGRLSESGISNSAKTKLINFKALVDSFIEYAKNANVKETVKYIIDSTLFLDQFAEKTEENVQRAYNVGELLNSIEYYFSQNPDGSVEDYLSFASLSSEREDVEDGNEITLATIHAVKGLEFKCVFVCGLDEKILPIARSFDVESDMEEERRLMYVAVTRAMERLYLTRALSRYMYGSRENMTESRFLREAKAVLQPDRPIERKEYKGTYSNFNDFDVDRKTSGYSSTYAKSMLISNKPKENLGVDYGAYKTGKTVMHVKFGMGVIIAVKGEKDNIVCDVAFKGVGVKSLSVKFAPMEIYEK